MLKRRNFTKSYNWIIANLIDLIGFAMRFFRRLLFENSKDNVCSNIKKILIIRTDGIGDALVTIPLLRSLKAIYPEARIDCLIRPKSKEVLENNPYINKTIHSISKWDDIRNAVRLRRLKYDIVINPRPDSYFFNHFIVFFTGGKRRVGFAMKGGGGLLTDVVPWKGEKNIVELLLDISMFLGENKQAKDIEIFISNDDVVYAKNLLRDEGISENDLIIGLNPFAGHPFIWPINRFIKLSEKLGKRCNIKVVFIGDKRSEGKIKEIINLIAVPSVSLAGRTNLRQFAALMKRFRLLITVDSSPRHIANAVNTPVIVLRNGANSNVLWGKYSENEHIIYHQVPCSPCGKKYCPENERVCMTKITLEEVLAVVKDILKNANRN